MFEGVEVFQEEEPGGLLGVIEFAGAAGVFPEDVVDVFEGLFEHGVLFVTVVVNISWQNPIHGVDSDETP